MSDRSRPRLGLRGEVVILLPASVLLLALLAAVTAMVSRDAVARVGEGRRDEALRLARRIAETVSVDSPASLAAARELIPGLRSLAIYGPDLRRRSHYPTGSPVPESLAAGDAEASVAGPSAELPGRVVAIAPTAASSERRWVRVELAADAIDAARRSLAILVPLALGVSGALTVLILLYLRPLLAPYDALLHKAREAGLVSPDEVDELAALISSFEAAVAGSHRSHGPWSAAEEALADELESGLMLVSPRGELLALNPAGAALLGIAAPPPGAALEEVLTPHPRLLEILRQAVTSGEPVERAEVPGPADGAVATLGVAVHSLRRSDGRIRGYLALFNDQTRFERLAAERRLAEGLTQLGELAAGVAHELRNSLGVLQGYLELSAAERDPAALLTYRREIDAETARLRQVVDDFLAFARPGTHQLEPLDLRALLHRVAREGATAAHEPALDLAPSPLLRGDAVLLERAFRNLLRNAAAASVESGSTAPVAITLRSVGGGWEVCIADRGPGVPESIRDRLFQPFVSARPGGTGLGLALARRVISMHGGTLRLSDRDGGGTAARVEFPADAFVTNSSSDPRGRPQ